MIDMLYRVLIIDDEKPARVLLEEYVSQMPALTVAASFSNALQAKEYMVSNEADIILCDIQMPGLSGLDFIRTLNRDACVIFTTAHSKFAVKGFDLNAVDYLLKPIGYSDFLKASEKAKERFFNDKKDPASIQNNEQFLFIKSEHKILRIDFNNIKYIEGMRDYIRIHLDGQKPIMTLAAMKSIKEHLPADKFMQVHRSYIVNLKKITTIERNRIIFDDSVYIPVSEQYKKAFQDYLDDNFLK